MPTWNLFMRILKASSPEELDAMRKAIASKYSYSQPSEFKSVKEKYDKRD